MESFCTNVLESYTVISANAMHIEIQESIHNLSKSNMREIFAFLHTRVKTKQQLKSFRRFIRQTSSSSNHSKIESITDLDKKINDLKNKEKQLNEKIEKLTNNIDRLSSIVTEKENAAQFQESIISKSKCNILSLREKSLQLATILKNAKEHISWCQGNANSLKELGSFVPSVNNRQKISQILCGLEEAVVVGLANHQNLNLKPIILNNVSQVELVGHFLTTTAVNIEFSRCQDNNCFTPNIVHNIRLNQVNDFKKFQKLGEKNKNNETIISEFEAVIRKNTSNALCMEKKSKLKLMTKINQFLKNYVLEKAKLRDFGFDYKLLESLNEDIKYKIKSKNVSKTKINALSNSILENFEGVKILRKENNEYGDILQQQLTNFMAVLGTFKSSTITTARSFLLLQENKKNSSKFETEHVAILNTLNFPSFLNHTEIFQHIGKKKDFINFIKFFFMKNGIDWNSSKIENCSFTNIFSTDSLVIEKNDAVIAELIGKIKNNYEFYKTEIIPLLNDSITKSLEKCIAFNEMKEFESEWANYHQFLTRITLKRMKNLLVLASVAIFCSSIPLNENKNVITRYDVDFQSFQDSNKVIKLSTFESLSNSKLHSFDKETVNSNLKPTDTPFFIDFSCDNNVAVERCNFAQQGFINAGNRIAQALNIKNTINVKATFRSFCNNSENCTHSNTLGQAAPAAYFSARPISEEVNWYFYPQALVKQLKHNTGLSYNQYDILADFNSDFDYWFSTNSTPIQPHETSFEFVVSHEFTHGLGFDTAWSNWGTLFSSVATASNYLAPLPFIQGNNAKNSTVPNFQPMTIFDKFTYNSNVSMIEYAQVIYKYVNPNTFINFVNGFEKSAEPFESAKKVFKIVSTLKSLQFIGSDLPSATKETLLLSTLDGLYKQGSSISHVDLGTYLETPDFLMVPAVQSLTGKTLDEIIIKNTNNGDIAPKLIYGPKTLALLSSLGYATHSIPAQLEIQINPNSLGSPFISKNPKDDISAAVTINYKLQLYSLFLFFLLL